MDRNGQHTVAKPCDERDGDEEEGHGPSGNHRSGRYTSTPRTVNRQRQGRSARTARDSRETRHGPSGRSTWAFDLGPGSHLDLAVRPEQRFTVTTRGCCARPGIHDGDGEPLSITAIAERLSITAVCAAVEGRRHGAARRPPASPLVSSA
jgi:hypothetical protein